MALDEDLLSLLPQWMIYARLVIGPPTAFAATFLGTWIGARLVLPRQRVLDEMHWATRARAVHSARAVTGYFILLCPVFFGHFYAATAGPFDGLPAGWVGSLAAISAFAGATLASRSIHRLATGESLSWARHTRNQLLALVILAPHVLILFFMLASVDGELDVVGIACAGVGSAAMLLAAVYSGLPLARLVGAVRPASPRLAALVDELSCRMDVAPRSVEEVDLGMANAWALPAARGLVFTPQLVSVLDDEALRGIIAHELGHLKDPLCARVIGLRILAFLPLGFIQPATVQLGLPGLAGLYVCFVAIQLLSTRLGRRGEERADAAVIDVEIDGADYARALERLHAQNVSPAVTSARTSHPSLYDRMLSAGIEPDFSRPLPPSPIRTSFAAVAAATGVILTVLAIYLPAVFAAEFDARAERRALVQIAWRGARAEPLFGLARARMGQGQDAEAMLFVDAALERRPTHHAYLAARADLLARSGACQAASDALYGAIDSTNDEHGATCRWIERATETLSRCEPAVARR